MLRYTLDLEILDKVCAVVSVVFAVFVIVVRVTIVLYSARNVSIVGKNSIVRSVSSVSNVSM